LIFITHQNFFIEATRWGKTSTFFQVITVLLALLAWEGYPPLWAGTFVFVLISGIDYLRQGIKVLNLAERSQSTVSKRAL